MTKRVTEGIGDMDEAGVARCDRKGHREAESRTAFVTHRRSARKAVETVITCGYSQQARRSAFLGICIGKVHLCTNEA